MYYKSNVPALKYKLLTTFYKLVINTTIWHLYKATM